MLILVFPVGLFILWKYDHYSKNIRIALTLIILVFAMILDKNPKVENAHLKTQSIQTEATSNANESIPNKVTSDSKDAIKPVDLRDQSVDIGKLKHGQIIIIAGEVIAGNGKKAGRDIVTDFGSSESQPFILQDKKGKEWTIVLDKPSFESLYEKQLTIKGVIDQKTDDPAISKTLAIVKAEILI